MNASLRIALEDEREWQTVMMGHRKVEVCSIEEPLFADAAIYMRVGAYRYKAGDSLILPLSGSKKAGNTYCKYLLPKITPPYGHLLKHLVYGATNLTILPGRRMGRGSIASFLLNTFILNKNEGGT